MGLPRLRLPRSTLAQLGRLLELVPGSVGYDGAVGMHYLRLIPTEPTFVPSVDQRQRAVALVWARV